MARTHSWDGIVDQLPSEAAVLPSCFEIFINTLGRNAALNSSRLFLKISHPNKTKAVKLRKWSNKHRNIEKRKDVTGQRGQDSVTVNLCQV